MVIKMCLSTPHQNSYKQTFYHLKFKQFGLKSRILKHEILKQGIQKPDSGNQKPVTQLSSHLKVSVLKFM